MHSAKYGLTQGMIIVRYVTRAAEISLTSRIAFAGGTPEIGAACAEKSDKLGGYGFGLTRARLLIGRAPLLTV